MYTILYKKKIVVMDFASVTRGSKRVKNVSKGVSGVTKGWSRLDVSITPTGTISERRSEETSETVRSIYDQLDFLEEASERVYAALQYFDEKDTDFFKYCEEKFVADTSACRFVSASEWAWFDSEVPPEVESPRDDSTMTFEELEELDTCENLYVECEVCGENDGGSSKCGCVHVVRLCTFTSFDGAPGSFLVPRSVKNVPVESLQWEKPTASEICSGNVISVK